MFKFIEILYEVIFGDVNFNIRLCLILLVDRWDFLRVVGFISIFIMWGENIMLRVFYEGEVCRLIIFDLL